MAGKIIRVLIKRTRGKFTGQWVKTSVTPERYAKLQKEGGRIRDIEKKARTAAPVKTVPEAKKKPTVLRQQAAYMRKEAKKQIPKINKLSNEGESLAKKLDKVGATTDASNIRSSISLFKKRGDLGMLESTIDTAKAILKFRK